MNGLFSNDISHANLDYPHASVYNAIKCGIKIKINVMLKIIENGKIKSCTSR
jgi:hypothetical protein